MSLVEGEERATIPSMSWSSVVGDDSVDVESDSDVALATEPLPPTSTGASVEDAVSFKMTSLGDEEQVAPEPTPAPTPAPAPPPPPISFTMGTPAVANEQPTSTVLQPAAAEPDVTTPSARPDTSSPVPDAAPLSLSIPLVGERPSVAPTTDPDPVELPVIVEATPPDSVTASVAALHTEPVPVVESAPVASPTPIAQPAATVAPAPVIVPAPVEPAATPTPIATPAPAPQPEPVAQPAPVAVPASQPNQAALSLPRTSAAPAAPLRAPDNEQAPRKQGAKKDRSTALARMGFFLLFVAAVVSAGVIFGRPYLFPAEWEDNALPYAEAIEQARGTEFVEPVLLTAQDNAVHRDLVAEQLLGDAQEQMPMWRSLGLAGPDATDDASLRDLIAAQSPVLYSTADGQVYYDQTFNQAHRDRLISQAMTTAAIDQEVTFSSAADQRGIDVNVLTDAHVVQQSAAIAELAATTAVPVPEPDVAALAFLPPVLDYRLTAPLILSEILPPVSDLAPNPLEQAGPDGPAAVRSTALETLSTASNVAGDASAGNVVSMDRGFWYLVFASHLDATTAYDMSNKLERAGLQTVTAADGRTCAVATFATANGAENERLGLSLATWTTAVSPEFGASVISFPDTTVQLRSCDPVGAFVSNARFGVGRELIGWRATETVVADTLIAEGADEATITRALAQVGITPSVQNLISLPAGTPPSEVAAGARAAAAAVVAAAVAPPPAEAGG